MLMNYFVLQDANKILPYYALKGTERGVPIPIRDRKAEMEIGEVENVQITYLDITIDSF